MRARAQEPIADLVVEVDEERDPAFAIPPIVDIYDLHRCEATECEALGRHACGECEFELVRQQLTPLTAPLGATVAA